LPDDRIAWTQRQTLPNAFFGARLEIEIELVLPVRRRCSRVGAEHRRGVGVQPVDPGKVVTSPKKKRALSGPVEVLNLNAGVAGISAPWVLQVGISPSVSEPRGKQRLLDR